MNERPIETERLGVRYGAVEAVRDVSLSLERGDVYALLGHNGSGKSSLVQVLLGHRPASSGWARVFGGDAWTRRRQNMAHLAGVPETPNVPPSLRVRDLLRFVSGVEPSWDRWRAEELLGELSVDERARFGGLSRGQKTQVLLTVALAQQPKLLILDDPTLGLDPAARRLLFDVLIDEAAERGTTILLTTHDLGRVEAFASRVGILHGGHLVVDEPLDSLKQRFRRLRLLGDRSLGRDELAALEPIASRARSWGTEITASSVPTALPEEVRRTLGRGGVEMRPMTLEEIFLAIVARRGEVTT